MQQLGAYFKVLAPIRLLAAHPFFYCEAQLQTDRASSVNMGVTQPLLLNGSICTLCLGYPSKVHNKEIGHQDHSRMNVPYKPLIWAFTWPYYHSFCLYTLYPILVIAKCKDSLVIATLLIEWRKGKLEELKHIKIGVTNSLQDPEHRLIRSQSTISAAAILAIFSWPSVEKTFWVAKACWYTCLVLSLWALIISSQHAMLLNAITVPLLVDRESSKDIRLLLRMVVRGHEQGRTVSSNGRDVPVQDEEEVSPRFHTTVPNWKMVWIWQSSGMLMGYAWVSLLAGMTLHVCTPLIHRAPWGDEIKVRPLWVNIRDPTDHSCQIAIVFLSVATASILSFTWGSYGIYRNPIMTIRFEAAGVKLERPAKDTETLEVLTSDGKP